MGKTIKYTLIFVLILSLSISPFIFGNADTDKEELNVIEERINQVQELFTQGKNKEKDMINQIDVIDKKIDASEKEIVTLQNDIKDTEGKIDIKLGELEAKQEDISDRNDVFNDRLRAMYMNGEVGYIEIMLGSEDFSEFMNNADMVNRIYQHDVDFLEGLKAEYAELDLKKLELESFQNQLVAQKKSVEDEQSNLEISRGEAINLRKEIASNNELLAEQERQLQAYADELIEKINQAQSDDDYAGGVLTWPSPGHTRITDTFGYRIHPILKTKDFHTGLDIGVPANSKIVSANGGTVIMSGWSGGYGKAVVVDHGGGIVTLYAHNNQLLVRVGDKVAKGQQIAISGSTGMSTGPHLHFEVRENGEYVDPMIWLK